MQYSTDNINHLIRNRRSVFPDQFDAGKSIPDEIIEAILINATWAPTHGQNEPWHFSVFTGNGLKQLASFQSELYRQEAGSGFAEKKYLKLQQQPLKASHIIAIGMKRSTNTRIPEIEDIEAVACAVQNIYLSVTAYGLGGYWTTGGITYYENAKAFFGLGEPDKLLGFFYIGYIAVPSTKGRRADINTKINWKRE
ncbi:nitroreductase [Agriterribacter sp.]|uniref:nitroreductase family protein n=1 Tax=Agriterribacter sp. TaxID=2821509 RepID=UPI002C291F89|nr:nitroreductase [Agriterribacter sp.]HTN05258.1 nitroreductase [Agriterribacter sp.]